MTSSAIARSAPSTMLAPPPSHWPAAQPWALFLDLDGTLCAYRDDPAEVALTPAQRALLRRLQQRLHGALCVLSGRSAADLARIFGDLQIAHVGEHGAAAAAADVLFLAQLARVEAALRTLSTDFPGTWVERKPSSCVLHYRRVPQLAECLAARLPGLDASLDRLRRLDGVCVFEFAARGSDKGSALRAQMQTAPFRGRVAVAVGDDVTDEDAFAAARALGGFGVAVGGRASVQAGFHLADTAAVQRWLQQLAGDSDALD
ncbi:trehalose-phosphatase [Tahibacter harae]|uniref:Trehalose 6-phosphate phosphatase n=1 Tax=Tahibacter harae TaxID=2963937 RepID=A0ABT1QTK6_9GAMM|nr:trehalose-phosphatase [Tahibacter harae]MCQ4165596.1 trehalose-phosphatase [Tahibacter harae]